MDTSAQSQNPGWPLRNLLTYLRYHHPSSTRRVSVLSWRDTEAPISGKSWRSRLAVITTAEGNLTSKPSVVGWEKTVQGKLAPRVADLGGMMDPRR